jgi:hypothetical protein
LIEDLFYPSDDIYCLPTTWRKLSHYSSDAKIISWLKPIEPLSKWDRFQYQKLKAYEGIMDERKEREGQGFSLNLGLSFWHGVTIKVQIIYFGTKWTSPNSEPFYLSIYFISSGKQGHP